MKVKHDGLLMKALALVQIFVLAAFTDTVAVFRHGHIIDGQFIEHSHPYVPSSNHTHSQTAAASLAMLTVFGIETVSDCVLDAPHFVATGTLVAVYRAHTAFYTFWSYFQRPPPVQA